MPIWKSCAVGRIIDNRVQSISEYPEFDHPEFAIIRNQFSEQLFLIIIISSSKFDSNRSEPVERVIQDDTLWLHNIQLDLYIIYNNNEKEKGERRKEW